MDCEVSIRSYGAVTKGSLEDRLWISCIRNTGFNQRGILFISGPQMTASHVNTDAGNGIRSNFGSAPFRAAGFLRLR